MPRLFRINVTHNIVEVQNHFLTLGRVTIPAQFERDAEQAGRVLVALTKKYIPGIRLAPGQRRSSSGRLGASYGVAEPHLTHSPEFNPDDAIFEVRKVKNRIHMVVGTHVPYGAAVNDGFTMKGPRKVFFENTGQVLTIPTFFFPGYHFIEKGKEEAEPIIRGVFQKGLEQAMGLKTFRSLAQPRNIKGQFTLQR